MSLFVKICGLNSQAAVAAALEAGADALGFVFHAGSPRNLTPGAAGAIAALVPDGVLKVAVTRHPSPALLAAIVAEFAPDVLQTDLVDLANLRLDGLATLPVLRSGGMLPATLPARCLYEGALSGTGRTADWGEARALAARTEVILAGGLGPGNVATAIAAVRPFGVDVSSGVESAPGVKDPRLIQAFVTAARAASDR